VFPVMQYDLLQFLNLQNFLLQFPFLRKDNRFVLSPSCVSVFVCPISVSEENVHKIFYEPSVIRGKPHTLNSYFYTFGKKNIGDARNFDAGTTLVSQIEN
jgi:hypothetical protein